MKTAISNSNFFKFDDVHVTLLRTQLGALLDNLTVVYNLVKQKVAAEPKIAEETTNSIFNGKTKIEEVKEQESTVP
jgi:hypothetical protein